MNDYRFSPTEKDDAICKRELDYIQGNYQSNLYEKSQNLKFMKINGITDFWKDDEKFDLTTITCDILSSCSRYKAMFVYVIMGDEKEINVYIGTNDSMLDSLLCTYEAEYPGIDIEIVNGNPVLYSTVQRGGIITGIPSNKYFIDGRNVQIESICKGMSGTRFVYMVCAEGESGILINRGHKRILDEISAVFPMITKNYSGGTQGNVSAEIKDYNYQNYFNDLEFLEENLKCGMASGMWKVSAYYAADTDAEAIKLGNIIKASFAGEASKPETFRIIPYNDIATVIKNVYILADVTDNPDINPIGRWDENGRGMYLTIRKFQTLLNSHQLAVMCRLPIKEYSGYYIDDYVEFDMAVRDNSIEDAFDIGQICTSCNSKKESNNRYKIRKNDFTRHALIIGVTGGGKTNTSKSILYKLWNVEKIPFMVIESAKREYWELRNLNGFEDLTVYTLGNESKTDAVRYRINPFEANKRVSLQTHIDYILSTFKAAFELYPPMPYVLEQAVYEIYADKGWDIVDNKNKYGYEIYPTLSDLYNKIAIVVDKLGYHQEVQSNVKAALQSRVYSLMIGGKGAMMNTRESVPIERILSEPVVMELEDLGDDETKSFVIGLLMVQLYEYRKSQMTNGSKKLNHILMIEEAHRLLRKVNDTGEGGNVRAKSVEFFCNMLAEIRTYGQGIIIADQIPTKLASDTIKNTNLKIVHRTVDKEDREAIGKAMNMTDRQIDYLSSLKRGYAAVYSEGDNKPKCVKMPLISDCYHKSREEIIAEIQRKVQCNYDYNSENHYPFAGCTFCNERCEHYKETTSYVNSKIVVETIIKMMRQSEYMAEVIDKFLNSGVNINYCQNSISKKICLIGCLIKKDKRLGKAQQQQIIADYLKYCYEKE